MNENCGDHFPNYASVQSAKSYAIVSLFIGNVIVAIFTSIVVFGMRTRAERPKFVTW